MLLSTIIRQLLKRNCFIYKLCNNIWLAAEHLKERKDKLENIYESEKNFLLSGSLFKMYIYCLQCQESNPCHYPRDLNFELQRLVDKFSKCYFYFSDSGRIPSDHAHSAHPVR